MGESGGSNGTRRLAGGVLFLLAVGFAAYAPAIGGGFVWDDDAYVTANRTLREEGGLRRIWFEPGSTTQYYPLVHTSFWIETRLGGFSPAGFHAVNVLLHAGNALLVWFVLRSLAVPGAFLAALLFLVHPVHVESVAWITERKNVLSGFFYLSALFAYLRFALPVGGARGKGRGRLAYTAALALFTGALLAKTVTATLPAAIVVILWWKRGRIGRSDLAPLVPFFLLGAAAGLGTAWIERSLLGARGGEWDLSLPGRIVLAGRALWFYLAKLVWPARLTFIYPRWTPDPGAPAWWAFPAGALVVAFAAWSGRRRLGRGPLAAALFFGVTLAPALGFVDVYPFRYSFVADHFQYLASLGPIVLFAARGAGSLRGKSRPLLYTIPVFFFLLTWRQCGIYDNLETLWRDTIAKNGSCWMAENNLGRLLAARGETAEAAAHFGEALRIRPEYGKAHNNLGLALEALGRREEAIGHYKEAVRIDPRSANARGNLGLALLAEGRMGEAIGQLTEAVRLRPRAAETHTNLAVAFARAGRLVESERGFREAIRLAPDDPEAHYRLGLLLARTGRAAEAAAAFGETLRLSPEHEGARRALGGRDPG